MSAYETAKQAAIERMARAACKCAHRYNQHDPEGGLCDHVDCADGFGLNPKRCRGFSSPDPDRTTIEYLLDAALTPDVCDTCGGRGYAYQCDDPTDESIPCESCGRSGQNPVRLMFAMETWRAANR